MMKGLFFLTQALLPLLADGGRIVNLSTDLTRFASPGFAAYAAAKGAVEVLSAYRFQIHADFLSPAYPSGSMTLTPLILLVLVL